MGILTEQYCDGLEKFSRDMDTTPMITLLTDGKGTLSIFASKILTHEQKCQLMLDGAQVLIKGIEAEKEAIKNAKILNPNEYKRIND